jgi:hypothetical protein
MAQSHIAVFGCARTAGAYDLIPPDLAAKWRKFAESRVSPVDIALYLIRAS